MCPPCREFKKSVFEEVHQVVCLHCGQTFMPGAFSQHQWRIFYRDRFRPKGVRKRDK